MTDPLLAVMERVRAETWAAHKFYGPSPGFVCTCGERVRFRHQQEAHLTAVTHAAQLDAIRPLIEAQVYRYGERVCRCAEDKAIMATHAARLEAGQ